MNFNLPTIGVALALIISLYFLFFGNKKDVTSWFGVIVVVAAILIVSFWSVVSHFLPGTAATAAALSPSHLAVHVVHATPTMLPTTLPTPKMMVQQQGVQPVAAPANPFTALFAALNYSAGATCLGAILFFVVALTLIGKRRRPSPLVTEVAEFPCPECGKQNAASDRLYSYKKGRTRLKTKLCTDCVGRLQATRIAVSN